MSAPRTSTPGARQDPPAAGRILVFTGGAGERDDALRELDALPDGEVIFLPSIAEAAHALEDGAVRLVIAGQEVATDEVNTLLETLARLQRDLPLLVIRKHQADEPSHWSQRGIGVLRCPLVPDSLRRSVGVVLGLRARLP